MSPNGSRNRGPFDEQNVGLASDATKTPPVSHALMRNASTPFFRDIRMPTAWNATHDRERFMLDTLAERRAPEKVRPAARVRAFLAAVGRAWG